MKPMLYTQRTAYERMSPPAPCRPPHSVDPLRANRRSAARPSSVGGLPQDVARVTIFGVDVSHHQTAISWPSFAADGIDFAICRASIAGGRDGDYPGFVAGAAKAGLIPGAYHFLYEAKWADSARQADVFLDSVGQTDGKLLMLDVERDSWKATVNGKLVTLYSRPKIADVLAWVARFRQREPYHPLLIYGPRWYWTGTMGNPKGSDLGPLVQSHFVTVANDPEPYRSVFARVPASWWNPGHGGWPNATILQFTSRGKVGTYSKNLDVNAFRGSRDDLLALTHDLPDTSTGDMPGLLITDVVPFSGKVTLTKPWKAWNVDTDTQTGEPIAADGVYRPVASCKYHNGLPGYLIDNNNRLLVLPAGESVGLKVEPDQSPDLDAAIAADRAKARIVWG